MAKRYKRCILASFGEACSWRLAADTSAKGER